MRSKRSVWLLAGIVLAISLAGCNIGKSPEPTPDVAGLYTAAAETLVAQLNDSQTQTAQAVPPTAAASPTPLASFTPLATFPVISGLTPFGTFAIGTPGLGVTPLPTLISGTLVSGMAVGCNNAVLIGETIPDGTKMSPRHSFSKSWSMMNAGTCTWDEGYKFAFKQGDQLQGEDIVIKAESDFTKPNHSQAFVVPMEAPKQVGDYQGWWQMQDDAGTWFGSLVWIKITVQ